MTPAGSLAMANAEVLSGITIAQLRQPGTPIVYGSGSGPLDMRTTVATYVSPQFMLHCKAIAELGHRFYKLPVWGFAGCSDSKQADLQAGVDSSLWILWTALSGANLVHDVGYVESGMTCSYEMIVICDEIIGFVRRLAGRHRDLTGDPGSRCDRRGRTWRGIPLHRPHHASLQGTAGTRGSSTAATTRPGKRQAVRRLSKRHARSPVRRSKSMSPLHCPKRRTIVFAPWSRPPTTAPDADNFCRWRTPQQPHLTLGAPMFDG